MRRHGLQQIILAQEAVSRVCLTQLKLSALVSFTNQDSGDSEEACLAAVEVRREANGWGGRKGKIEKIGHDSMG